MKSLDSSPKEGFLTGLCTLTCSSLVGCCLGRLRLTPGTREPEPAKRVAYSPGGQNEDETEGTALDAV
jgi:hypothetical protein